MASSCTLFGLFSNSRRFTHTKSQIWTFEKLRDLATVGPHSFVVTIVWSGPWRMRWISSLHLSTTPTRACYCSQPTFIPCHLLLWNLKVVTSRLDPLVSLSPSQFLSHFCEKWESISPNPGVGKRKGQVRVDWEPGKRIFNRFYPVSRKKKNLK